LFLSAQMLRRRIRLWRDPRHQCGTSDIFLADHPRSIIFLSIGQEHYRLDANHPNSTKGDGAMLSAIFFGILTSIVIYIIVRVLFEEYDHKNILLYYVYGIIFLLISVLILILRFPLSRVIYNIYFWNTILISTFVIAVLIGIYIFVKTRIGDKKKNKV